jgi:hypothetical protein
MGEKGSRETANVIVITALFSALLAEFTIIRDDLESTHDLELRLLPPWPYKILVIPHGIYGSQIIVTLPALLLVLLADIQVIDGLVPSQPRGGGRLVEGVPQGRGVVEWPQERGVLGAVGIHFGVEGYPWSRVPGGSLLNDQFFLLAPR